MRAGSLTTTAGAVCLLIGVVLLVVEAFRALTGNGLGTIEQGLMWAGLGEVVIGVVLLLLGTVRGARPAQVDVPEDEDEDEVAVSPPA